MANTYYENLKHPLWQKKRLEIMQRDGFECTHCGEKDKTLAVHHKYYERGLKPWEYDATTLITLCDKCHVAFEQLRMASLRSLARLEVHDAETVLGFINGLEMCEYPFVSYLMRGHEHIDGICMAWPTVPSASVVEIIESKSFAKKILKFCPFTDAEHRNELTALWDSRHVNGYILNGFTAYFRKNTK